MNPDIAGGPGNTPHRWCTGCAVGIPVVSRYGSCGFPSSCSKPSLGTGESWGRFDLPRGPHARSTGLRLGPGPDDGVMG